MDPDSSGSDSDSESSSTKMSEVENEVGAAGVATAISKSNIPNTDPRGKPAKQKSIGVHLADGTDEELDLEQLRGYMMKKPKAMKGMKRRAMRKKKAAAAEEAPMKAMRRK